MPELPEVETVVRGLRLVLPGRRITGVRLSAKTDFIDDPASLERELPGTRVTGIERFGKFMVIGLDREGGLEREGRGKDDEKIALLMHLGMTGQIVVTPAEAPVPPHTHFFLALDDGRELRYTDIRRFGRIRILLDGEREALIGRLGLDPLEMSEKDFRQTITSRSAQIKALLMDQRVLRGMGNIYTDESLWRAKVHPRRLGTKLSEREVKALYKAIRGVLTEAIRSRGSSVSDYVDSDGQRGEFQLRHRVYQREGKKCLRCGGVIRRAIVAGRSSFFCPRCQRAPRLRRND
ncbi:MAG TPA: bifunctional DNA-formamidopyrimidine glycosylase/DNA-(apurinic or apyrimidinic site) lyase [Candidatus Dormibacteraeota bacterium]|nr:bifunctional DNA-formamidopyrimidine glycosylase/DNA-(apurinic or apyrimidinic site) lyase [Candidatus Dormibacteraeota bacterium]